MMLWAGNVLLGRKSGPFGECFLLDLDPLLLKRGHGGDCTWGGVLCVGTEDANSLERVKDRCSNGGWESNKSLVCLATSWAATSRGC